MTSSMHRLTGFSGCSDVDCISLFVTVQPSLDAAAAADADSDADDVDDVG